MKKMRTGRIALIVLGLLCVVGLVGCNRSNYIKIKLAEVAHSVFYAPQYVALSEGFFEEEGLEIELYNANGADKVTSALISGGADIGLQGPEPTIYLYNNDQKNYLVNFAQLTTTDGSFIFGRSPIENFTLNDLSGKSILGGRKGGVPEMTLEYVLKEAGLEVIQDATGPIKEGQVNVRTDIAFAAMAGQFLNGEGDFTTLFEPTATELVKENKAYLLGAVGDFAGEVSFTAYSTSIKYFNNNQDIIERFMRAIYKGQQFVKEKSDLTIAKSIQSHFTDIEESDLVEVVARYRSIGAWAETPIFSENGFNRLQDIMSMAGELEKRVPITALVDTRFARKIVYGEEE